MTRKTIILLTTALTLGLAACSGDDAENAAADVANQAEAAASKLPDVAAGAADRANAAASRLATDAVAACRSLAERGAWDGALEVCRKAHELRPNDMQLEHAYQQAQAAAGQ